MEPKQVTVKELFDGEGQYIIPIFQRHYEWGKTGQWVPLWRDITTKTRKRQEIAGRDAVPKHFTGALVTQQRSTSRAEVSAYDVIDGQQRLTTFQIILCAFRGVCREKGGDFAAFAEDAEKLLVNTGIRAKGNGRYKLVPTRFDFAAMAFLVNHEGAIDSSAPQSTLVSAYNYFHAQIKTFVGDNQDKAFDLLTTIREDFGFVEILIEGEDEPEVIFESLNARGKPLLAFDLLRNYLFLRNKGEDRDELYSKYWEHFETDQWKGQGKAARRKKPLLDMFLQHFLTVHLPTEKVEPLFQTYREKYKTQLSDEYQIRDELRVLHEYSQEYLPLAIEGHDSDVGRDTQIYHLLDFTSLRPFLLYLLAEVKVSGEKRKRIFRALESYTVRRILCTSQGHKEYNKFFPELINNLRDGFSERKFLDLLIGRERESDARKWHRDYDVRDAFGGRWSDIGVNRNIVRYILYRIECQLRNENPQTEDATLNFSGLTLEHILPQRWDKKWVLPTANGGEVLFADIYTDELKESNPNWLYEMPKGGLASESYGVAHAKAMERESALESIGNLTLLTQKLNSGVSNSTFGEKKEGLEKSSLLFLNKEVCRETVWDVEQIREREKRLSDIFCQIWPDAQSFLDNIPDDD